MRYFKSRYMCLRLATQIPVAVHSTPQTLKVLQLRRGDGYSPVEAVVNMRPYLHANGADTMPSLPNAHIFPSSTSRHYMLSHMPFLAHVDVRLSLPPMHVRARHQRSRISLKRVHVFIGYKLIDRSEDRPRLV